MKIAYKLILNLADDKKVDIISNAQHYIPQIGSIVNIKGDPYIVYKVSATVIDWTPYIYGEEWQSIVYVDVFKAGQFDVEINGNIY